MRSILQRICIEVSILALVFVVLSTGVVFVLLNELMIGVPITFAGLNMWSINCSRMEIEIIMTSRNSN